LIRGENSISNITFEDGLAASIDEMKKYLHLNFVSEAHKFLENFQNENYQERISIFQHRINSGDEVSMRQGPRRIPFVKKGKLKQPLNEMQKQETIEPFSIPCASTLTLGHEKVDLEVDVDYKGLDEVAATDDYPLSRMDDLSDNLQGPECFSMIDLKGGFGQVKMDPYWSIVAI